MRHATYLPLVFLAACGLSVESSGSAALPSGRLVAASCDSGQVTLSVGEDEATVRMAGKVFTVRAAEVRCDDAALTAVPAAAKRIDIEIADGKVRVLADREEVHAGPLP